MLKNRKLLMGFSVILGSICLLSEGVGAWSLGTKKPKTESSKKVDASQETTIEQAEAHKIYDKAAQEEQDAFSKYLEACIEYKKANLKNTRAYETLQKATAVWTEALAAKDSAYEKWITDCSATGPSLDDWCSTSQKERETCLIKENAYIEWVKCDTAEKEATQKREEAYSQYAAAAMNKRNAHDNWSNFCSKR